MCNWKEALFESFFFWFQPLPGSSGLVSELCETADWRPRPCSINSVKVQPFLDLVFPAIPVIHTACQWSPCILDLALTCRTASFVCLCLCVCVRFLGGVELKGAVMEEVTVMMMTLSRNSRTALYSRAGRWVIAWRRVYSSAPNNKIKCAYTHTLSWWPALEVSGVSAQLPGPGHNEK